MRFQRYLNEAEGITLLSEIALYYSMNEAVQDKLFTFVKKMGHELGFKVRKSESLISYLKRVDKNMEELIRNLSLFMMTDIKDNETRKELFQDTKDLLRRVDRREVVNFLLQLDKISLGLTAHLRHALQSIFGIEVAAYGQWKDYKWYVLKELDAVENVLKKMKGTEKEIEAVQSLKARMHELDFEGLE